MHDNVRLVDPIYQVLFPAVSLPSCARVNMCLFICYCVCLRGAYFVCLFVCAKCLWLYLNII